MFINHIAALDLRHERDAFLARPTAVHSCVAFNHAESFADNRTNGLLIQCGLVSKTAMVTTQEYVNGLTHLMRNLLTI
jgi:hypothetical protein